MVLLVSEDQGVIADVTRLAAAAGVRISSVAEPAAAMAGWVRAALVLVDTQAASWLTQFQLARRDDVHMLARQPAGEQGFRDALALGAETVVDLPGSQQWLVELLTDVGDRHTGQRGPVSGTTLGVVAGVGGAGATTFAAALAETLSARSSVLLVDCDPLGAGVDRVLGLESAPGIRWDAMAGGTGRLSGRSMRTALPTRGGLAVLSWPADTTATLSAPALREVLSAGTRGFDTVIVDLPRHLDPLVTEAAARCDHLIVLTPGTVAAVAATVKVVRRLPESVPKQVVVRTGRGGVPAEDVAAVLGVPLLATMRDQRGLDEWVDLGAGPLRTARGPLAVACRGVAAELIGPAA